MHPPSTKCELDASLKRVGESGDYCWQQVLGTDPLSARNSFSIRERSSSIFRFDSFIAVSLAALSSSLIPNPCGRRPLSIVSGRLNGWDVSRGTRVEEHSLEVTNAPATPECFKSRVLRELRCAPPLRSGALPPPTPRCLETSSQEGPHVRPLVKRDRSWKVRRRRRPFLAGIAQGRTSSWFTGSRSLIRGGGGSRWRLESGKNSV